MLLTRSPLGHPPEGRASLDLHVLSTPPAFVLSQDQTLRRCIRYRPRTENWTLSISINQRNPCHDYTSRDTGYYLALTFGTLLSSQRADAQKPDPSGPRPWLDVPHYAGFQRLPTRGAGPADLPVRAAHTEHYTTPRGRAREVPSGGSLARAHGTTCLVGPFVHHPVRPRSQDRGERTAAVTRLRQGGTARSPGGRRASPSWGWSAPRCAGRNRP